MTKAHEAETAQLMAEHAHNKAEMASAHEAETAELKAEQQSRDEELMKKNGVELEKCQSTVADKEEQLRSKSRGFSELSSMLIELQNAARKGETVVPTISPALQLNQCLEKVEELEQRSAASQAEKEGLFEKLARETENNASCMAEKD